MRTVLHIKDSFIELYQVLKLENIAASGGEAKQMISEGLVQVNGQVERRKGKKISAHDVVSCGDRQVEVRQEA